MAIGIISDPTVLFIKLRVLVKVTAVTITTDDGDDGRSNFPTTHATPVDVGKPFVLLDVHDTISEVSVALGEVSGEETFDQVLGIGVDVGGPADTTNEDLFVELKVILIVEGGVTGKHLKDKDAQGVPIDGLAIPLGLDDFWGEVIRGTTQSPGDVGDMFGEAKVGDLDVTQGVEEDIFGFEITVDDVTFVEVLKGQDDLSGVEFGNVVGEALELAKVGEHFPAAHVFEDHVQVGGVGEGGEKVDEEGMTGPLEDFLFIDNVLDLLETHDLGLLEDLHGKVLTGRPVLDKMDTTKATGTEGTLKGKVLEANTSGKALDTGGDGRGPIRGGLHAPILLLDISGA